MNQKHDNLQLIVLGGAFYHLFLWKDFHRAVRHIFYVVRYTVIGTPYTLRRKKCGLQLYESLAIKRDDKTRRQAQWAANYRAFDAPAMLLFLIDDAMQTGSYLAYGMFLQSVMLSAMEEGLATCPQAALAEYPDIIRQTLNYPASKHIVCGIALGYEDKDAAVNQYRT